MASVSERFDVAATVATSTTRRWHFWRSRAASTAVNIIRVDHLSGRWSVSVSTPRVIERSRSALTTWVQRAVQRQSEAEEGRREALRQVAEALKARNRYRGVYQAVMALHEVGTDGRCVCGENPCPEREAAKEAEFRMHRAYET